MLLDELAELGQVEAALLLALLQQRLDLLLGHAAVFPDERLDQSAEPRGVRPSGEATAQPVASRGGAPSPPAGAGSSARTARAAADRRARARGSRASPHSPASPT